MTIAADIKARLEGINPQVFRTVGAAAEFSALTGEPLACPAIYVVIEGEASTPNERMTGTVLQRTSIDIATVIVTKNVSDGTGGAATDDIDSLKKVVRHALIGFAPPSADDPDPIEHIEGNLLKARNGYVWWRDLYGTDFTQEETS